MQTENDYDKEAYNGDLGVVESIDADAQEIMISFDGRPVIVADHVELLEDWFRDAIVQRWRDGIALVPASWLKG